MIETAKYNTARPYLCAYLLLRDGDKIAMIQRAKTGWMDDHWSLVGGKVENNETFTAAAEREALEEAGVEIRPENLSVKVVIQIHDTDSDWVDVVFEATDWEGKAYNAEPHLHSELRWFAPNEIPENIVPVVRAFLEAIAENKSYVEYGWD